MKKIFAVILIVMLFTAAVLLSPAVAGAETVETIVKITGIQPVDFITIRVFFEYKGQELSWYETLKKDEIFDTTAEYKVTIYNNIEVIDAIKEEP